MPAILLDINVLIALSWNNHVHHAAAKRWFAANRSQQWATCPLTQCGFVRISCNPKIIGAVIRSTDAAASLRSLISQPGHVFWQDELSILDKLIPIEKIRGHRQVTDAYLFALSLHHAGRFATFDQGVASLAASAHQKSSILLIPTT